MNIFLAGINAFIISNFVIVGSLLWIRKNNSPANKLLGLFIFLHALVLSFNILIYTNTLSIDYYFLISIPACLIGPAAFLYCKALIKGKSDIVSRNTLLHITPALALPFILILIKKLNQTDDFILFRGSGYFPDIFKFIVSLHIAIYYFIAWQFVKKVKKTAREVSEQQKRITDWAESFSFSLVVFITLFFFLHFLSFTLLKTASVGSSFVSPLICFFLYVVFIKKAIAFNSLFNDTIENNLVKEKRTAYQTVSEEILDHLEIKLKDTLIKEKPYLDKELNLKKLSLLLDSSPKHLSQLINSRYQKNFNDFINTYRVEESRKMLLDPEMNNLKLEAIAEAAGFNSRASFFSIFKKITGETPAAFRKEHHPV